MKWTIGRKMSLIGVMIFMALAIPASNAYLTNRAIQYASAQASVRNEQLELIKKLNAAHLNLMSSATDAIIAKSEGDIDTERMRSINANVKFFENNFKKLEEIADTGEEKQLVSTIRDVFPKLSEGIKTDLVKLIRESTAKLQEIKTNFIRTDARLYSEGEQIENDLAKLFAAVQREREEATYDATLRIQQIDLINKLMRLHSDMILSAKNAIIDKRNGKVNSRRAEVIRESVKFVMNNLDNLVDIVDTPYTKAEKEVAEHFCYMFPKLAKRIHSDLAELTENHPDEPELIQINDVLDMYSHRIADDLAKIFHFVRTGQSEATDLELLQNDKFTTINQMMRAHSELMITSMRALTYRNEGRITEERMEIIDRNVAFITENLDSLINMAATDDEDIAAQNTIVMFPKLARGIRSDLKQLIEESALEIKNIETDFIRMKHALDHYGSQTRDALVKMLVSVQRKQKHAAEASARQISRSTLLGFLTFFVTLALIVPVFFLIRRSIVIPLHRLKESSDRLAQGNLNQEIDIRQNDELGSLARSFEYMRNSVREKIIQLQVKQASLKKAEEKYRSIFENAVEGIFQTTPDGLFISANPAQARIMGYNSPDEVILSEFGLVTECHIRPGGNDEPFSGILCKTDQIIGFETQYRRRDRSMIWVSVTARTARDSDGSVLYYEGSMLDITERKEKEKAERAREAAEAVNRKIMESIRYAKMIQASLLPSPEKLKIYLPDSFFIWMPRDIVSGDILFTDSFEGGFVVAVIDCTGHGVPGAFMTMIASSGLRRIIRDEGCSDPGEILKRLNFFVKTSLHQDTEYALSDDGLDAAIVSIQSSENKKLTSEKLTTDNCLLTTGDCLMTFAGARLPLICIHNHKVTTIKGDRQSIGYKRSDLNFNFSNHTIMIEKGMCFYMFTDGFTDQLGENEERRFGSRRFRELLNENSRKPFDEQRNALLRAFNVYKGENERQDDVTVVGFGFDNK
ncbi:SpoIIE family protein phosphatase [Desulfonema magnum]|nr:SpoIIE family protein phosphatase [Desulfonema magnum]